MKTRYAVALLLLAAPVAGRLAPADAASPRAYYLNQWGGVNACGLARRAGDRAYCNGAAIPSRDPRKFDCRKAEVIDEFRFCRRALPKI